MKTPSALLIAPLVGWLGSASVASLAQDAANVTQLIRDSQAALAAEQVAEAERLARGAVDLDPAHPPAWRQYGLSLLRGGKPQEAVAALQRTVALDEKDATAWRGLALACWQTQQQNEAVRALSAYLRLKPEDAGVWRDLASWLTRMQRSDQAIAALERVVALKPDDVSAWRELGAVLSRQKQDEKAVAALERVVALKPDDASAWRELAAALSRQKQDEKAVAALERVVALKPEEASAWREMATGLTLLKRNEQALSALERVSRLKPEDGSAWRELAVGLIRLERYEQAVPALERAVTLAPADASAWRELAALHQRGGRLAEAAQAFEQALAARPGDPVTRRDLGWVLWSLGRREEALSQLTEALEAGLEARDRVIYQVVARLSEEGAGSAALAFMRKVDPHAPPAVMGLALAKAGRVKASEPILMNAWQTGDRSPDVGLYLAYARAVNGQVSQMAAYLEPLLESKSALSPERADLALETLRLGSNEPETPLLTDRLERVLERTERCSRGITDILELSAAASRERSDPKQALRLYRRVLERDPERASWTWVVLLAERVEGRTPDAWLASLGQRVSSPARRAGISGVLADRQGRPEEALTVLRQSLALDPNQPQLRQILFDCLLRQGLAAEARAETAWFAKRVEAGDVALRADLAEMLKRLGDTRGALEQWAALHKTHPKVPYYGTEKALALYRLGLPDEAMDVLKAMAGALPCHPVFELMAEIETARTNRLQSLEWASRGLAIDPSPGLLRMQAESLEGLGRDATQALASARAYLERDPGHVPMTLLAGRMLETVGQTNELETFHVQQLCRNPVFVPSLTALRDRLTREARFAEAAGYARRRAEVLPGNAEALRGLASSLAQQGHFRAALQALRPPAKQPLAQAVPLLVYASIMRHPYPGRTSVDQISRHIKRLADDGYVFVNAFSQISASQDVRRVMLILADPEAEVIEALDPVLRQYNARVVYAGNAAVPALTLSGQPIPEGVRSVLAGSRWRLASGGPGRLGRQLVNEAGALGNPLTHLLGTGESRETPEAFSDRLDRALSASARALKQQDERLLVYPSGDFGQRSLDTGTNLVAALHTAVSNHFTHAVYFDDCGFLLLEPAGDPLRIPARLVPPEWDEQALAAHLGACHPLMRARLERARILYWHGQHEEAHAAFREAERAGVDARELNFPWGVNSERQGDLPATKAKLLAAQALEPGSEPVARALARLEARRRPQATAFLYGWKDNEDRDHNRYGATGDAYVSERVRLGAMADRDHWSTDSLGSEYGTRYGLRGLAYLWPQIWLDGQIWRLEMDDLDDHWGGEAALRLPNPILSGHVYLFAAREEIETVEALRKNIDADTYALRTYTRLADLYDLFANVSLIDRSDGNDTRMLDGKLLYRLQEWPYVGIGWRFRFADSDRDPPEYWAPEELEQHQLHINVRGAWNRLSYFVSAEAGYSRDRDSGWGFVWGARGEANYVLTDRFSLNGETGYFETTDYDRVFGRLSLTARF